MRSRMIHLHGVVLKLFKRRDNFTFALPWVGPYEVDIFN
jgi:hypothetical protein